VEVTNAHVVSDRKFAIGLDIGGTFTDFVLLDEQGGIRLHKLLTTPDDPARAAIQGLGEILSHSGVSIDQVELLVHSTTLVTNTIIQENGTPTGLLTTKGFRDVLEMRLEHRYDIYDLFLKWPNPLVPRHRRLPIDERVTVDGQVLAEPRRDDVDGAVDRLVADGVKSIAVSFLHSYKYPQHEQRVAGWVRERHPELLVTLSSEVAPVFREYERTSTAVADAYVRPLAHAYIQRMEDGLRALGYKGHFYLMLSGGGSASAATARKHPIRLVESGPAAGALAAALYGRLTHNDPILAFDMGGTTAKSCAIEGARPAVVNVLEVARAQRFKPGSGMPLVVPSVELLEIGAGGGSIARVDPLGLLKVGPDSAGAAPGPACYGRGGQQPTVTDANLLLGYLDEHYFLGGEMPLDRRAAEHVVGALGDRMQMSATQAAWGIHEVVNENMAQAARMHALEKNWDPRRMTLVAFGGAGPAHAGAISKLLGIKRIILPLGAGATSALGCLAAPLSFQFTQSLPVILGEFDWSEIRTLYGDLEARGRAALREAGVEPEHVRFDRACDARIYGQIQEMTVAVPSGDLSDASVSLLRESFGEAYRRLYSRYDPQSVIEVINWKVTAFGPTRPVELRSPAAANGTRRSAHKGTRPAYFADARGFTPTPVYDRYLLEPGSTVEGPAIIEEREATAVMQPGMTGRVDEYRNLIVEVPA
jgi:N-methylhydantoinase A/oxoprolinase/acetone carboxylase beta subunit